MSIPGCGLLLPDLGTTAWQSSPLLRTYLGCSRILFLGDPMWSQEIDMKIPSGSLSWNHRMDWVERDLKDHTFTLGCSMILHVWCDSTYMALN